MAISGYNSVNINNNVPFNNDPGQVINQGDMLYWNTAYQAFEVGPGIYKLSNLENDLGYLTEAQVLELVASLQSGGTLDLSTYATDAEVSNAISTAIGQLNLFSGNYNDLTNKPALFSGSYTDLTNRPSLFSGYYEDLINKPDLSQYATINQVSSAIANINYSNFVTDAELANALQSIDYSNFVTDAELANALQGLSTGGTSDLSNYYSKSEVDALVNGTSYVTSAELASAISNVQHPTNVSAFVNDSNYVTQISLNNTLATYYTKAEADALHASIGTGGTVDLSGYVTDAELTTALSNYQPTVDLSAYALKTELFSGDYNDLTNKPTIPDITGLASITYVDTQIATAITGGTVDLTGYVTDAELATALSNYQPTIDLSAYYTSTEVDNLLANISTGNVDLTGYATETYVTQQIAAASIAGVANLDDLNDVAIGSLPAVDNADDFYLLEYNPNNQLWESRNFGNVFATQAYVSSTVATALTGGSINLDGYATEQYVEQALLERGPHFSGNYYDLTNRPQLFSGDYRDLINKPANNADLRLAIQNNSLQLLNIEPEPDTIISSIPLEDFGLAVSNYVNFDQISNVPELFSGNYEDLVNKPTLFSGNYLDLANKPYIPSIAGLASEEYVDNRWAEPVITGDRTFTGSITFEDFVQQKLSTVNSTSTKRDLVLAVQTTNDIETEVLFSDASRVGIVSGTTAMFKATVVASSGADKTAFIVKGVIDYTGTLSIVGNNIVETISDSDLGWTANLTADTVNEALRITVTGSAATVVDWTVFLEISEVIR